MSLGKKERVVQAEWGQHQFLHRLLEGLAGDLLDQVAGQRQRRVVVGNLRADVDPAARTLMPAPVLLQQAFGVSETRGAHAPYAYLDPRFDFWGLHESVVYLRSTDDGRTWRRWRSDPFRALQPQAYTPQADIALADGTLIRRVSGVDLANDPSIPHEAILQTLHFNPTNSRNQTAWSAGQAVLHDRSICTYQLSRTHQLRDGRLVSIGSVVRYAQGTSGPCASSGYSFLLLVAKSSRAAEQGRWSVGMPYTTQVAPNEWDVAELPNGNLLALMRTRVDGHPARLEATLRRHGNGWVMGTPHALPALPAFLPSGHPDLLATRQGAVLSFSTSGTAYSLDGGRTWRPLRFAGLSTFQLRTRYYPYAIQAPDGTIHVFSSNGYDIPYGAFNESIVSDTFRLQVKAVTTPNG